MSRRARLLAVVALCATVAVAVAVGGALLQDEGGTADASAKAPPAPPLDLGVFPGEPHAAAFLAAERAYGRGDRRAAGERFQAVLGQDPGSVPAAVGAAVAAWPGGTIPVLRKLVAAHPASALVRLHLGLALNARGEKNEARSQWRAAAARDPDTRAAVQADSLLHPDLAPGLPFFVPRTSAPAGLPRLGAPGELSALRTRAKRGKAADWLVLGAFLQQLGRPVSAREAFDRALALAPRSIEAQAAAAVGRFDKDDPSRAFSRLGPLARAHPRAALVRFHLGVMLLWIRAVEEAKRQLTLAVAAEPGSRYGAEARQLLTRLQQS